MDDRVAKLEQDYTVLKERMVFLEKLNQELVEQNKELLEENKEYAEKFAHLPKTSDKEKKMRGESKTLRYKMVTVLFADIKGFTNLAEQDDAQLLIDELDSFFIFFDEIVERYNIEKIRSIGDSYIAAGGIPKKNRTNPIEVVLAALEVSEYMVQLQKKYEANGRKIWDLTIGIHTGGVIAQPNVGKKKVTYDIKGDTVDVASRIEASCEAGKINISQMTYELVKEYFACEYKSKMPIKYKGDINMYYVKGLRPDFSVGGRGLKPNQRFKIKFQMIKYQDLEEFILDMLERELPKHLYYHNLKHTIDVITQCEIIGSNEGVSEAEMLLLKTAAVFHDAGQVYGSRGHEAKSCEMAGETLPQWGYSDEQINVIKGIIMATKLPPEPQTLLQEVICDSDLDYVGRQDFIPVSDTLYRELKVQNLVGHINDWNKLQIKFLEMHNFFTPTALSLRQVNKELQIDRLKSLITE